MVGNDKLSVVDASAVLALILPDEDVEKRSVLLKQVRDGFEFFAPELLFYEVVNGIRGAVVRKRLAEGQQEKVLKLYDSLGVKLKSMIGLGGEILKTSMKFQLSAYDAAYVVLAVRLQSVLYTADSELYRAVRRKVAVRLV